MHWKETTRCVARTRSIRAVLGQEARAARENRGEEDQEVENGDAELANKKAKPVLESRMSMST